MEHSLDWIYVTLMQTNMNYPSTKRQPAKRKVILVFDPICIFTEFKMFPRAFHWNIANITAEVTFCLLVSVRLLSVLRGHTFFSSPPQWPMKDFEGFLSQILSITFIFLH